MCRLSDLPDGASIALLEGVFRVRRLDGPRLGTLKLSGRLTEEYLDELGRAVAAGPSGLGLDLEDVTDVDEAALRFLVGTVAAGTTLTNASAYIRARLGEAGLRDFERTRGDK